MPTIGDKFVYLKTMMAKTEYSEHLALDMQLGAVISIRTIPLLEDANTKVYKQS